MTTKIVLTHQAIASLDLTAAQDKIATSLGKNLADSEQQLQFEINFEQSENDPREFSEIPEIRLWFIRLDAVYPWLPFLLDWKEGELVRYVAMLVPHQFNRNEGIIFNPEALEIFVMNKIFVLSDWLKAQNLPSQSRLKSMAQLFGYELDDDFLEMI
ncbi:MAG: CRR6 family NdhI maturation factor [Cyanobacteria bacterium J06621_8]